MAFVSSLTACNSGGDGSPPPAASGPAPVATPPDVTDSQTFSELTTRTLDADGDRSGLATYDLIRAFGGSNSIEAPDLYAENHPEVQHIYEDTDAVVGNHFVFIIHRDVDIDRDRLENTDRQRNEIKTYASSEEAVKGFENETFIYTWKFQINPGMEVSTRFSHFFQLKAVGGSDSHPILTISGAERSGEDGIEVRHSPLQEDNILQRKAWSMAAGEWIEVYCRVTYSDAGNLRLIARRLGDGVVLFDIDEASIDMWRGEESSHFVRPKWGIYRSILDRDNLRPDEETVRFANFRISEVMPASQRWHRVATGPKKTAEMALWIRWPYSIALILHLSLIVNHSYAGPAVLAHPVDPDRRDHRQLLEHLFEHGVESCKPGTVLPPLLPASAPAGRNIVLGAGKAAAEMAAVAHARLAGKVAGLVVTRYGHGATSSTGPIEVLEAGHPVPDAQSAEAASRMLEMAASVTSDDRVLFMFSGGGSALLCAPIAGITVEQKQDVTRFLLHSGARINEINLVRKFLSRIKGGGLASTAAAAQLMTFVISDVVGDDPADVASGPSLGTTSGVEAAIEVLSRYGYTNLSAVTRAMRNASKPAVAAHPVFVAATARTAVDAMARAAQAAGWEPIILGYDIEGDATEVGRAHVGLARQYRQQGKRVALLSGGELTVRVTNRSGRGGPNLEYLASLMLHLDGASGIEAIACDSDGIDGSEDNAGGYLSSTSLERATANHLDPASLLESNDTYTLFAGLNDLIKCGPTRTNVNDLRVILIDRLS